MKWNRVKASFGCVSEICLYTTYRMLQELETAQRAVFTVPVVPGTKNKTAQQIISGIPSDISRQQHGAWLPNCSKNYHEGNWSQSFWCFCVLCCISEKNRRMTSRRTWSNWGTACPVSVNRIAVAYMWKAAHFIDIQGRKCFNFICIFCVFSARRSMLLNMTSGSLEAFGGEASRAELWVI